MPDTLQIRFSGYADFPVLKSMWSLCFGDSEAAAENIFSKLQKPENIIVGLSGGKPVSMLSIREFTLSSPLRGVKAAYIYGVATLPQYRGKGFSSDILEHADGVLPRAGFACSALVPATETLFEFYSKRGFSTAFNINKASLETSALGHGAAFKLEPLSPSRFADIRDACFGDSKMYARWDEDYLSYIVSESEFYGGGAFMFSVGGESGCAVCHRGGDTVYIKELCAPPSALDAALRSIYARFTGAKRFVVYLSEDVKTSYTNNLLPFGMVKWYDNIVSDEINGGSGGAAYLAHVLD